MQVRKAIAYGSMVLSLVGYSAAAYANSASNENTGPFSDNNSSVEVTNKIKFDTKNTANANADFDINMKTGNNKATDNTTAGDVMGGAASGSVGYNVSVDQASATMDLGSLLADPSDHSASNTETGPHSSNDANVEVKNDVNVKLTNNATSNVDFNCNADTGHNSGSDNTTVGDISSGDASCSFDGSVNISQGN